MKYMKNMWHMTNIHHKKTLNTWKTFNLLNNSTIFEPLTNFFEAILPLDICIYFSGAKNFLYIYLSVMIWNNLVCMVLRLESWIMNLTLREKCPHSEFFWSILFLVRVSECGKIWTRKTPSRGIFHSGKY